MTEKAGTTAQPPRAPALVCPKCRGAMRTYVRGGIVVELCEDCRGIFLDQGELERLIDAEGGGWSGIVGQPDDPTP
jgi:Zn-finger nucleic acid-binding protein